MESVTPYRGVEVFSLHDFPRALELDEEGLHHPRSARSRSRLFTPYAEFTHLARSSRTLWLGTRRSTYLLPRRAFVDPNAPENLVRALLSRISRQPQGSEQLARMAQVEELSRSAEPLPAIWGLCALCVVAFGLQLLGGLPVYLVGYMSPILVLEGDLWRVWTANLLHASLPHLVLNVLAIGLFGFFAGRPLGTTRTLVVMGVAALGSMTASATLDEGQVVGASGVALGLVGSAFWLELYRPDALPAWWRIPRSFFWLLLGLEAALTFFLGVLLPIIAWGAHLGGFAAGFAVTPLLCRSGARRRSAPPRWLRAVAAGVVAVTALSIATAARQVLADDFMARYAVRFAALPDISPGELNNMAWLIATAPDPSRAEIEAALRLAERAVSETERQVPELLDTLAEVQFQLGWGAKAVDTIEEAIARDPEEPYYREQRRRFLGERAAEDRPESPPPRTRRGPDDGSGPAPAEADPGLAA